MKNIIGEGVLQKVFNWALNKKVKKVGKRIQLDPKLAKLSREFEKSAKELEQTLEKRMATPGSGGHTSHYKNLQNILSQD